MLGGDGRIIKLMQRCKDAKDAKDEMRTLVGKTIDD